MDEQTVILLVVVAAFALFLGLALGYRMGLNTAAHKALGIYRKRFPATAQMWRTNDEA